MGAAQSMQAEQTASVRAPTAIAVPHVYYGGDRSPTAVPRLSPICRNGFLLQSSVQRHASSSIVVQQQVGPHSPSASGSVYNSATNTAEHLHHSRPQLRPYVNRKMAYTSTSVVTQYSDIPLVIDETPTATCSGHTSHRGAKPIETVLVYSTLSTSSLASGGLAADDPRLPSSCLYIPPFPNSIDAVSPNSKSDIEEFLEVKIPRSDVVSATFGNYTGYIVQYNGSVKPQSISRRFRQFVEMHIRMLSVIATPKKMPQLPPKKFSGNLDPVFVEFRRHQLEEYLQLLLRVPNIVEEDSFWEFLEADECTITLSRFLSGSGMKTDEQRLIDVHLLVHRHVIVPHIANVVTMGRAACVGIITALRRPLIFCKLIAVARNIVSVKSSFRAASILLAVIDHSDVEDLEEEMYQDVLSVGLRMLGNATSLMVQAQHGDGHQDLIDESVFLVINTCRLLCFRVILKCPRAMVRLMQNADALSSMLRLLKIPAASAAAVTHPIIAILLWCTSSIPEVQIVLAEADGTGMQILSELYHSVDPNSRIVCGMLLALLLFEARFEGDERALQAAASLRLLPSLVHQQSCAVAVVKQQAATHATTHTDAYSKFSGDHLLCSRHDDLVSTRRFKRQQRTERCSSARSMRHRPDNAKTNDTAHCSAEGANNTPLQHTSHRRLCHQPLNIQYQHRHSLRTVHGSAGIRHLYTNSFVGDYRAVPCSAGKVNDWDTAAQGRVVPTRPSDCTGHHTTGTQTKSNQEYVNDASMFSNVHRHAWSDLIASAGIARRNRDKAITKVMKSSRPSSTGADVYVGRSSQSAVQQCEVDYFFIYSAWRGVNAARVLELLLDPIPRLQPRLERQDSSSASAACSRAECDGEWNSAEEDVKVNTTATTICSNEVKIYILWVLLLLVTRAEHVPPRNTQLLAERHQLNTANDSLDCVSNADNKVCSDPDATGTDSEQGDYRATASRRRGTLVPDAASEMGCSSPAGLMERTVDLFRDSSSVKACVSDKHPSGSNESLVDHNSNRELHLYTHTTSNLTQSSEFLYLHVIDTAMGVKANSEANRVAGKSVGQPASEAPTSRCGTLQPSAASEQLTLEDPSVTLVRSASVWRLDELLNAENTTVRRMASFVLLHLPWASKERSSLFKSQLVDSSKHNYENANDLLDAGFPDFTSNNRSNTNPGPFNMPDRIFKQRSKLSEILTDFTEQENIARKELLLREGRLLDLKERQVGERQHDSEALQAAIDELNRCMEEYAESQQSLKSRSHNARLYWGLMKKRSENNVNKSTLLHQQLVDLNRQNDEVLCDTAEVLGTVRSKLEKQNLLVVAKNSVEELWTDLVRCNEKSDKIRGELASLRAQAASRRAEWMKIESDIADAPDKRIRLNDEVQEWKGSLLELKQSASELKSEMLETQRELSRLMRDKSCVETVMNQLRRLASQATEFYRNPKDFAIRFDTSVRNNINGFPYDTTSDVIESLIKTSNVVADSKLVLDCKSKDCCAEEASDDANADFQPVPQQFNAQTQSPHSQCGTIVAPPETNENGSISNGNSASISEASGAVTITVASADDTTAQVPRTLPQIVAEAIICEETLPELFKSRDHLKLQQLLESDEAPCAETLRNYLDARIQHLNSAVVRGLSAEAPQRNLRQLNQEKSRLDSVIVQKESELHSVVKEMENEPSIESMLLKSQELQKEVRDCEQDVSDLNSELITVQNETKDIHRKFDKRKNDLRTVESSCDQYSSLLDDKLTSNNLMRSALTSKFSAHENGQRTVLKTTALFKEDALQLSCHRLCIDEAFVEERVLRLRTLLHLESAIDKMQKAVTAIKFIDDSFITSPPT